jgi:spermidine synthase
MNRGHGMQGMGWAIGLLGALGIAYQLALMRVFSIGQWHHFAYMVISMAMLGFGAGGALTSLAQAYLEQREEEALWWTGAAVAIAIPGCYGLSTHIPFETFELTTQPVQLVWLMLLYLLLALPFLFISMGITLILMRGAQKIGVLYACNMIGSGGGAFLAIVLLSFGPPCGPVMISVFTMMAVTAWLLGGRAAPRKKSLWLGAGMALALAWIAAANTPIRVSSYKGLSYVLDMPDAKIIAREYSPLSVVTAVQSKMIRETPGEISSYPMSALGPLPEQIGLYFDAGSVSPVNRFDGALDDFAYLDYVTDAAAYQLVQAPRTLCIGVGGGTDMLSALYHGATQVTGVEVDPGALRLLGETFNDFAGGLAHRPEVRLVHGEGRGYLQSREERYDLIRLPLFGSFTAAASGVMALSESYLYTVEAFSLYLNRLRPDGVLSVNCWLKTPARDAVKLFATAVEACERNGIQEPAEHLVLLRSFNDATLLISRTPLDEKAIQSIRAFCRARSFDLCYFPGIEAQDTNQFIELSEGPVYYRAAKALLGPERERFYADYPFRIRPATDERPYFFCFFKYSSLPNFFQAMRTTGTPFLEWGYVVLIITAVQTSLAGAALILFPLWPLLRKRETKGVKRWTALYFAALGLAYMFLEIAFMQRLMLFLAYPVYAISVVLTGFLFFGGLGSYAAGRFCAKPRTWLTTVVLAITLLSLAYLLGLTTLFNLCAGWSDGAKIVLALLFLAPLAFCMGMPFPLGLQEAANRAPALLPWAWAVNGCASVVGAALATINAIHFGFPTVVIMAVALYGTSPWTFARLAPR